MTISKRTLLHADLPVSAALAARDSAVATKAIAAAADDFGHIIHRQPQAVLRPASAADVAGLVGWAGRRELKVAARGQGHSTFGRAMADGGIVLDMSGMSTIHQVQGDHVVADAGATWSAVLEATLAHGLTPPVLTNYLALSVGGTLAVGGIGGTTFRHGMQTDNVVELDVVTGDGRQLTCSADKNSDLFDAVRAGLGQCAITTRATLRLMRAPERVRRYHLFYPDLRSLTAAQRTVLADGRFDYLQGALLPDGRGGWRFQLEGVVFYEGHATPDDKAVLAGMSDARKVAEITDLTYREDVNSFARFEKLLRSNSQWFHPHPWLLTFLPGSNAEQIVSEILQELTGDDVGTFGLITFYPMLTTALRTPLMRRPDEGIAFPFNLIRMPASDDGARVAQMVARNRSLYDRIRRAGGLLYPVSAFPMSRDDWKDHFGPQWSLLRDAKRRYDPLSMLTPGYNVL